jgi:hypothetical protein
MTGERPVHLDRCDICADRAVELGRWLDQVRVAGLEAADAVFPPERLAAQQTQILRRLEHLDQPAKVIAFPKPSRTMQDGGGRRVAPAWVGVGAAAGLVLGLVGGQVSARLGITPASRGAAVITIPAATAPVAQPPQVVETPPVPVRSLLDMGDLDRAPSPAIDALDQMTPSMVIASRRTGGGNRPGARHLPQRTGPQGCRRGRSGGGLTQPIDRRRPRAGLRAPRGTAERVPGA